MSDWTSSISREKKEVWTEEYCIEMLKTDILSGLVWGIQVKDFFHKLPRFYLLVTAYPPGNSAGDLFGMDKWPEIKGCKWPPIGGYKGHGLNHPANRKKRGEFHAVLRRREKNRCRSHRLTVTAQQRIFGTPEIRQGNLSPWQFCWWPFWDG